MTDQWIEDAAKVIGAAAGGVIGTEYCENWTSLAREIITKKHSKSCPSVTAEKLLAQVEAIAETIREQMKPSDCPQCAEMKRQNNALQANYEATRIEWREMKAECERLKGELKDAEEHLQNEFGTPTWLQSTHEPRQGQPDPEAS